MSHRPVVSLPNSLPPSKLWVVGIVLTLVFAGCGDSGPERIPERIDSEEPARVQVPVPGEDESTLESSLVFVSDRSGSSALWSVGIDGQNAAPLTTTSANDWGPRNIQQTGTLVFATEQGGNNLASVPNTGGEPTRLGSNPAGDEVPDWSPDGNRRVYSAERRGNRDIYVSDADGGNEIRLTEHPGNDIQPRWSPNGLWIAFVSDRDGNQEIYLRQLDGDQAFNVSRSPAREGHPAWSPDGTRLLFYSDRDGNPDLFLSNVEGVGAVNLTNHPADELVGSISPDGQKFAFGSTRDGNWEIYVADLDGSNVVRLTDSPGFDGDPVWISVRSESGSP